MAIAAFIQSCNVHRTAMWKTAGARFLAAKRFSRKQKISTYSVAFLSVLAIGVGLLDMHVGAGARNLGLTAPIVTAVISVFVLVLSLTDTPGEAAVFADQLHKNAVEINVIRARLEMLIARASCDLTAPWSELEELVSLYQETIRECSCNHEEIDYRTFAARRRQDPEFKSDHISWAGAWTYEIRYLFSPAWIAVISWTLVLSAMTAWFIWAPKTDVTGLKPDGTVSVAPAASPKS